MPRKSRNLERRPPVDIRERAAGEREASAGRTAHRGRTDRRNVVSIRNELLRAGAQSEQSLILSLVGKAFLRHLSAPGKCGETPLAITAGIGIRRQRAAASR